MGTDAVDTSAVSLAVQARLLAYPTPWFFAGSGLGLGVASCIERVSQASGPDTCEAGVFANIFVEAGVLVSDRYEVAMRIHLGGFLAEADLVDTNALDGPLLGMTVAYHS